MRVLVVDDNDGILRALRRYLEGEGHTVITAVDGLTGLAFYKQNFNLIDLVISDLNMPELNGYQMSELIYKFKRVPIILYTGEIGASCESYLYSVVDKSSIDVLMMQVAEIEGEINGEHKRPEI